MSAAAGIDVFIHTDGAFTAPPPESAYRARAFWSGQMRNLSGVRQQWDCCWRAPMNVESVHKYETLLEVSARLRRARSDAWVGVLADSDTFFQCTAHEFRMRFKRFGVPLVVSGERSWYPIPRNFPDPFGPVNMSWKQRYDLRHRRQFYPNSGLIAGSAAGFEALATAVRATPRFPCCAFEGDRAGFALDPCSSCRPIRRFPAPVDCTVEDQACLQVALASRRHAPAHAIDTNADLFLSLNQLTPSDLALTDDGRIAYHRTGSVPCVLHSNGHKGILQYLAPHISAANRWSVSKDSAADNAGRKTWQNGVWRQFRLQRAERHGGVRREKKRGASP